MGSWLGVQCTAAGWRAPGAAGHLVTEQREMDAGVQLTFSLLTSIYFLLWLWGVSPCCGSIHSQVGLPSSDKSLWKHLHRRAQRCVSKETVNPIRRTTKVRHHRCAPLCPGTSGKPLPHHHIQRGAFPPSRFSHRATAPHLISKGHFMCPTLPSSRPRGTMNLSRGTMASLPYFPASFPPWSQVGRSVWKDKE